MKRSLPLLLIFAPTAAVAHPGHDVGFVAGFVHPLTGVDHLLAMLAIGLWAASLGGRAVWALPVTFVAALVAGGTVGHLVGTGMPGMAQSILASLMVLGVVTALAVRIPTAVALVAVAGFGLVHGLAHGIESPADFASFAAGFVLASASLHLAGLALGRLPWLARALGALTALAGLTLAFTG